MNARQVNSPPDTGGVAAPSRKRREATEAAQTGWSGLPGVFRNAFLRRGSFFDHPVRSVTRRLRDFFLRSRQPLLYQEGSCQPPIPFGNTPENGGELGANHPELISVC